MGRALWTGPCPYPRYIASSVGTKQIWWLTYANKSEKRSNAMVEKLEVILKLLMFKHNTRPCSLPGLRREETIMATHAVDAF